MRSASLSKETRTAHEGHFRDMPAVGETADGEVVAVLARCVLGAEEEGHGAGGVARALNMNVVLIGSRRFAIDQRRALASAADWFLSAHCPAKLPRS
jgi:hypothetical protein